MTRMHCKDISDKKILRFLEDQRPVGRCNWALEGHDPRSIAPLFPPAYRFKKMILAKMKQLMRRGLVTGCGCGCRGDFGITEKGIVELAKLEGRVLAYPPYISFDRFNGERPEFFTENS